MKCLFVYNPNSGKGKIKKILPYIQKKFENFFDEYFIFQTKSKEDIAKFILENGEKVDTIVISGGDGTISESVNAIAHLKNKPNLAILPTGTVNDVAHSFSIPCNLKKAIDNIFTGQSFPCDCIKINNRYGLYVLGGGIFTETSYNTSQTLKKHLGKIAYAFHGIKKVFNLNNLQLQFDIENHVHNVCTPLFLFINSRYVAGFKLNKKALPNDGKATLIILKSKNKKPKLSDLIRIAKLFLKGTLKVKDKYFIKKDLSRFKVGSNQTLDFNLDGELLQANELQVSIESNLINIIIPK